MNNNEQSGEKINDKLETCSAEKFIYQIQLFR